MSNAKKIRTFSELEIKMTAAPYASTKIVREELHRTGLLPTDFQAGGAMIGLNNLLKQHGRNIPMSANLQMAYEAILRENRMPGGAAIIVNEDGPDDQLRGIWSMNLEIPNPDLVEWYGELFRGYTPIDLLKWEYRSAAFRIASIEYKYPGGLKEFISQFREIIFNRDLLIVQDDCITQPQAGNVISLSKYGFEPGVDYAINTYTHFKKSSGLSKAVLEEKWLDGYVNRGTITVMYSGKSE
jgi:hypothetical protein